MATYSVNPGSRSGGHAIGILQLDCLLPFIPGDVDNASTYRYPVIYKAVPGLTTAACLSGAPEFASQVAAAAVELEKQGVRGISSDCGFMLQFQDAVREAVRIPVAMSSLLQLPTVAAMLAPTQPIAVITADSSNLTPDFLARAGIGVPNPLVIRGLQDRPEFKRAVFDEAGGIDSDLVTEEVVAVTREIMAEHPDVGAVLLECSMTPPYAKAVQDAVGLPVFDFVTMINQLEAATRPPAYAHLQ
ncbi:aspartate/glutamate racemase family protein [Rhodoligotrophos defluvii]|uniref:aspartate/glutamate racemase family protein n=1 Tax=Rhodoligotrophos defluvii TaxID=2561934 RepID=UPI0010C9821C|nr:aspartate/glutamate racemase family protein [Rhodoligotrophos defluvii]